MLYIRWCGNKLNFTYILKLYSCVCFVLYIFLMLLEYSKTSTKIRAVKNWFLTKVHWYLNQLLAPFFIKAEILNILKQKKKMTICAYRLNEFNNVYQNHSRCCENSNKYEKVVDQMLNYYRFSILSKKCRVKISSMVLACSNRANAC